MSIIITRGDKGSGLTNIEMDGNLTNLNNDKYESGDSITAADLAITGDLTLSTSGSITGAGSTQGTATSLTTTLSVVTSSSSGAGVVLPSAAIGLMYTVVNATTIAVNLYPALSNTINNGTTNAPVVIPAGASIKLVGQSSSNWNTMVDTVIYDSSGNRLN